MLIVVSFAMNNDEEDEKVERLFESQNIYSSKDISYRSLCIMFQSEREKQREREREREKETEKVGERDRERRRERQRKKEREAERERVRERERGLYFSWKNFFVCFVLVLRLV